MSTTMMPIVSVAAAAALTLLIAPQPAAADCLADPTLNGPILLKPYKKS
jgi:hypothetical protein